MKTFIYRANQNCELGNDLIKVNFKGVDKEIFLKWKKKWKVRKYFFCEINTKNVFTKFHFIYFSFIEIKIKTQEK
jgi:hypothetical protein